MHMIVKDAAVEVFKNVQKPLHYKELTRMIMGKCNLSGKTPHETVRSLISTDKRFKRVAEGVYALPEWDEYPVARFAKDIAFDVLNEHGKPLDLTRLGESIYEERIFKGPPRQTVRNAIRNDERIICNPKTDLVSLREWVD